MGIVHFIQLTVRIHCKYQFLIIGREQKNVVQLPSQVIQELRNWCSFLDSEIGGTLGLSSWTRNALEIEKEPPNLALINKSSLSKKDIYISITVVSPISRAAINNYFGREKLEKN